MLSRTSDEEAKVREEALPSPLPPPCPPPVTSTVGQNGVGVGEGFKANGRWEKQGSVLAR